MSGMSDDDDEFNKRRRTPKATRYDEGAGPSHQGMESETEEESDSMQYENKPTEDRRRTVTTNEAHGRDPGSGDAEPCEILFYRRHFPEEDGGGLGSSATEEESSSSGSTGSTAETVIHLRPKPHREGKDLPRIHERLELEESDEQCEEDTSSFSSHSQKKSRTTDDDFGRLESPRTVERSLRQDEAWEPVSKLPGPERTKVAVSRKRSPGKHQRLEVLGKDTGKVKESDEFSRQHRRSKSVEDFNPRVKRHQIRRASASADYTDNTLDEYESLEEEVCYEESHPSYQRRKGSVDGKRSPGQKRKFISSYEDYSSSLQQQISSPIKHQKRKQLHKIPTEQRLQLTERRSSETSYPDSTESTRKPARKHSRVRRQPETCFITSVLEDLRDDIQEEQPKFEDTVCSTRGSSSRPLETSRRSDKIYVQGRRGFTSRPVSRDPWQRPWSSSRPSSIPFYRKWRVPAELAIFFQRNLRKFYTVCHGLLGGFGFAHCVLVFTFGVEEHDVTSVSEVYAYMSRMVKTWYYFFAVICLVSVLDRADLVHVHRLDFMDCDCYRVLDTILVLIYFCVLFLSNISYVWEEKLSVRSRIHDNIPAGSQISREEFMTWKKVSVFRGFLAVVGWILISVSEQKEMLLIHLRKMLKYRKKRRTNIATIN